MLIYIIKVYLSKFDRLDFLCIQIKNSLVILGSITRVGRIGCFLRLFLISPDVFQAKLCMKKGKQAKPGEKF